MAEYIKGVFLSEIYTASHTKVSATASVWEQDLPRLVKVYTTISRFQRGAIRLVKTTSISPTVWSSKHCSKATTFLADKASEPDRARIFCRVNNSICQGAKNITRWPKCSTKVFHQASGLPKRLTKLILGPRKFSQFL